MLHPRTAKARSRRIIPTLLSSSVAIPGRGVILNHAHVSRRHAYLQLIGGRMFCMDLRSRTGTFWESGPKRSGWLDIGQAVRIGPYSIRTLGNDQRNGTATENSGNPARQADSQQDLPQITLEFMSRKGESSTWQMTPMLALVGSAEECRVHLVGSSVSSIHCSLVRTPVGVWVVDLIGKGGIWLNEMVVRVARLEDGDRLQVGKFLICIHYDAVPAAGSPSDSAQQLESVSWGPSSGRESTPVAADSAPPPVPGSPPEIVVVPTSPAAPAPAADESPLAQGRDLWRSRPSSRYPRAIRVTPCSCRSLASLG